MPRTRVAASTTTAGHSRRDESVASARKAVVGRSGRSRRLGLTGRGWTLASVAVAALVAGGRLRYPGLTGVGIAAAVAVVVSVIGLASRRTVGIRRELPTRLVRRLDPVEYRVVPQLRGTSRGDELDLLERLQGELLPPQRISMGNKNVDLRHPLPTTLPGIVTLGPAELRYFGFASLARMRTKDAAQDAVLVLARSLPVRLPDNGALPVDTVHGDEIEGGGTELRSLRPYIPGDDLRRVNARISARMGRLMIRQDSEPAISAVTVVIDNRVGCPPECFAEMLDVATSLIGAATAQGLPVRWTARGRTGPSEVDADGLGVTERVLACLPLADDTLPRIGPSDLTLAICGPDAEPAEVTEGLVAPDRRGFLALARVSRQGEEARTQEAAEIGGVLVLTAPTAEMVLRAVSRLDRLVGAR